MLDPLTAIGLAGNIVQFVDFCSKVVSKAHRIYRSADGSLAENLDAETISRDLLYLTARVEAGSRPSSLAQEEQALKDLCTGCNDVAQELLTVLGNLKGRKLGKWSSFKQALKSTWSKDRIEALQARLAGFREELDLHILVDLTKKLDLEAITRSKEFEKLEESTQNVIDAVLNNRSAFTSAMQEQTVEIRKNINEQHGKTRAQISITASSLGDRNNHQHEKTREELARMTREAGILRRDMEHQLAEIKELITAAGQARGQTQQIDLEAEANAAASSWAAKDHAYTEIMTAITGAAHTETDTRPDSTQYSSNGCSDERCKRLAYINNFRSMGFFRDPDNLPKSLRIAVNNRFTRQQVEDIYADLRLAFSNPRPFFFIGSYMFPATICIKTTGTSLRSIAENMTPALLWGYNRHAVGGADWPALVPSIRKSDFVKGMAVFGLHDSQRKRIHEFQGGMFDLKKEVVEIELNDGTLMKVEASVYVWNEDSDYLVPVEWAMWSPEDFLQSKFYKKITEPTRAEEAALERS